jgi:hypothetical protein
MMKAKARLDARLKILETAVAAVPGSSARLAAAACLKAAFSAIAGDHFFESAFGGLTTEQASALCAAGQEGKFISTYFTSVGGEDTPVLSDVVKAIAHHVDGVGDKVAVVTKVASGLDVKAGGTGLLGIRTTKSCNKGWGATRESALGMTADEASVVTGVGTRALLALVLAPTDRLYWEGVRGDWKDDKNPLSWEAFALRELGPVILAVCALTLSADYEGERPVGLSPKVSWLALVSWIYVGGHVGHLRNLPPVGEGFEIPAEFQDDAGSFGLDAKIWYLFPKIYASNSKKECKFCKPVCLFKNNPACCKDQPKSPNLAPTAQAATTAAPASDMTAILMTTISNLNEEIARLKRENEHMRQMAADRTNDDASDDDGT